MIASPTVGCVVDFDSLLCGVKIEDSKAVVPPNRGGEVIFWVLWLIELALMISNFFSLKFVINFTQLLNQLGQYWQLLLVVRLV